jgi:hypothetical protein
MFEIEKYKIELKVSATNYRTEGKKPLKTEFHLYCWAQRRLDI